MVDTLTSQVVWIEVEKQIFAVVGMVSAKNEARTAGIVYVIHNRKLYFSSMREAWKVRHIVQNSSVSVTIPIAKHIPFMPWIKIPAATITFAGTATVLNRDAIPAEVVKSLLHGLADNPETRSDFAVIEIAPHGHFVTYGVGVPLMQMRDTQAARRRVPVA